MRRSHYALPLLICLSLVAGAIVGPAADTGTSRAKAKHYVCPPCGMPCDDKVYDHPGSCPLCGIKLIDQEEAAAAKMAAKKVAILIFTGVQIIDYTGPYEIFQAAGFDVYTVAETKEPVPTVAGMTVVPKYTFADAPQPDVLVVPGGGINGVHQSKPTFKWIRDVTAHAEHTMSVCNGAFILAGFGLLDGLTATTTYHNIGKLRAQYPKIKVVDDHRWVDNGKIITTAGLSAGIDGALHVVSVMLGEGTAQSVALGEEYDWRPRAGYVRGALADRLIPEIDLDAIGDWHIASTEGGTDMWEIIVLGTTEMTAEKVVDHIGQAFATNGKWTGVNAASAGSSSPARSDWKFSGRDGESWTGTLSVEPVPGQSRQLTAKLKIAKVG